MCKHFVYSKTTQYEYVETGIRISRRSAPTRVLEGKLHNRLRPAGAVVAIRPSVIISFEGGSAKVPPGVRRLYPLERELDATRATRASS